MILGSESEIEFLPSRSDFDSSTMKIVLSTTTAGYLLWVTGATLFCFTPQEATAFVPSHEKYSFPKIHVATATEVASSTSSSAAVEDDGGPSEFPPPLSNVDRLKRAAKFWSEAIPIVANYYGLIGNIKLQELLGNELSESDIEKLWDEKHADGAGKLAKTITELEGFYAKTAQIISSRQDLFPKQYTDALSGFTDYVNPMPASLAKAVVTQELLNRDESFEDVFIEFDEKPLGAATVAQVHRAVLSEKYGGPKEVAVKIQRPSIESKLLGDVANLKAISKTFREVDALPLDYYTVFAELEKQLADEFDFVAEAVAMDRINKSLQRSMDGSEATPVPLVLPRPVPGLVSKRVLVMDYLKGVPLSRATEEMKKKGIEPDSPEAKLFGRKLLKALTQCFGRNILETGFFHAGKTSQVFVWDKMLCSMKHFLSSSHCRT